MRHCACKALKVEGQVVTCWSEAEEDSPFCEYCLKEQSVVYLSGPIASAYRGTNMDERKAMFYVAEGWLRKHKPHWYVVNPLALVNDPCHCEAGAGRPDHNHTWECSLRKDIRALTGCDAMVFLPGWSGSRGAKLERDIGHRLGLKFMYTDDQGRLVSGAGQF